MIMISIIHKECQGLPYLELIEEDKKTNHFR